MRISQKRGVVDARAVFQETNKIVAPQQQKPIALVHEGLGSYDEAYQKEFFILRNPRIMNIRSASVRHEGVNSKVEPLNGSVREIENL
jgi:hypothetical protein